MNTQIHVNLCGLAVILGVALLTAIPADGLSDTICDNIEAEWQSDEPRLEGAFPFYTLLGTVNGTLCGSCCHQDCADFLSLLVQCLALAI